MGDFDQLWAELSLSLLPLQGKFGDSPEGVKRQEYFCELIDANEFEVALHTLCDFLLESGDPIDATVFQRITELHTKMGLNDDCMSQLKALLQHPDL